MSDSLSYCAELVRTADRDRYIASLFAPAQHRNGLHALYAFNSEIARVRELAHAPMPGEIRLQWWSEVIRRARDEEARANPVATALLAAIERYRLPEENLVELIESRRFDLYDQPMTSLAELEIYATRTASALFALAARILAGLTADAVSKPAGIAYAIAGLLRAFPLHVGRRQLYLPVELLERHQVRLHEVFAGHSSPALRAAFAELGTLSRRHLAAARERLATLPREAIPALLPLALVRPSLDRLARSDPFTPAEIPPWRRQWLIWRAAQNPARIGA